VAQLPIGSPQPLAEPAIERVQNFALPTSHDGERPFLTDDEIVRRLGGVEALLRSIIRTSQERPFVAVGQAADDLHRLVRDLMPETTL
jgi:hypothetical protein